jgi:O-antigen/teichoic acid export membrane protein
MIRDFGWTLLHHGVGRGALFVFFLLLPWLMEVDDVGRLTLTYTVLLLLLQPLLDTAVGTILVKYTARRQWSTVRQTLHFLPKAILSAAILVAAVSIVVPGQAPVLPLLGAAVLGAICLNSLYAWRRGLGDFRMEGIVGSFHKVMIVLVLGLLATTGWTGPTAAASAMLIGIVCAWILLCIVFPGPLRQFIRLGTGPSAAHASTASRLKEGLVLGTVGIVGLLYLRIDIVMLGFLRGHTDVGLYFTAARILEASFIVPHVVMLVIFPRLAGTDNEENLLGRTALGLGAAGILAAGVLAAIGRWIIPTLWGTGWAQTGEILIVLSLAAPPVFLGFVMTQALIAADLQNRYLVVAIVGLALNIGLNLVLIPHWGAHGAAAATVLTEIVVTAGAFLARISHQ